MMYSAQDEANEVVRARGSFRVGIWKGATGGGQARDYLGWLAAQWILWTTCGADAERIAEMERDAQVRTFDAWLSARFADAPSTPVFELADLFDRSAA